MIAAGEGMAMLECAAAGLQGEGCVGEIEPWLARQMRSQALSLLLKAGRGPRREHDEVAGAPGFGGRGCRRLLQHDVGVGPADTE